MTDKDAHNLKKSRGLKPQEGWTYETGMKTITNSSSLKLATNFVYSTSMPVFRKSPLLICISALVFVPIPNSSSLAIRQIKMHTT